MSVRSLVSRGSTCVSGFGSAAINFDESKTSSMSDIEIVAMVSSLHSLSTFSHT